jgi:uncharacterized protein (TIGR02231 family)
MNLALIALALFAATPKVKTVVVFPDRAQITRAVELPCLARAQVPFEAIPPAADPATLRAAARGGTVEALTYEHRTREAVFSKELEGIQKELRAVMAERAKLDDALRAAQNLTQLGAHYEQVAHALVSRELAVPQGGTKGWTSAFDAALRSRLEANAQAHDLSARRRAVELRRAQLERRASALQAAGARRELVAEVLVSCRHGRTVEVELTYLVGGASWTPAYEARARDDGKQVELSTFATVEQRTGEDWKGAALVLSTAVPSDDATPPEIRKLQVFAHKRDQQKKVLVRREEQISHARASADQGQGAQGMAAREQGLSVQLEVPGRSDVPGTGDPTRLFVGKASLPARTALRAAPALSPFFYRVAELTNTAPFPLLPGPLDLFGHSGFLGRQHAERVPAGGAFQLTFGLDDAVKVKRLVVAEISKDEGLLKTKRRFRYAYRLELSNHAAAGREVEVQERIPVSELDDVEVKVDERTTKGYAVEKADGVLTWRLKLAPREERQVDLVFYVDVPTSYDLGAL